MLYYAWTDAQGKEHIFSWITNIAPNEQNAVKIMQMGRSRWKIENEVFNTLKNQQYNFEHNFGHGKKHLCTNFALLMMLAFTVDQVQQACCAVFRAIHHKLKTRKKIWEGLKAVFILIELPNMQQVLHKIAQIYKVQLE